MNEPPDLADPGVFVPPAANFVTIVSNESGMETDGPSAQRAHKRTRLHKLCKVCNKKKRKHIQAVDGSKGCCCASADNSENSDSTPTVSPVEHINNKVTPSSGSAPQGSVSGVARTKYEDNDIGPFVIHVQKEVNSPNDNITLHPVTFGRFLKTNVIHNIVEGSVKKIGRNRITLAFSNFHDANSFILNSELSKNNLKAFIPTFQLTRMGLVRGVPSEWSPEEIIENASVPDNCGKIIKVRRINYKTIVEGSPVWKPTQSIVITLDGQVLPPRIFMCYNSLPVELYVYPTIQCYNCCRFGHTKIQCRSKPKCYKCGQEHTGDTCDVEEDNISCCYCSAKHFATSKLCPEFLRQKEIKSVMAEKCISYGEVSKMIAPIYNSYANVAS